jgi:hypothetical protein
LIARARRPYDRAGADDEGKMMRVSPTLLGLAAFASASLAEQTAPAPAPAPPPPQRGLSGLEDTVNQLQDTPAPAAATPPATAEPAPRTRPRMIVTRDEQERLDDAALDRAVQRGRLLAAIARAGQVGTQDMLAHVSDPNGAGIAGWIAEPEGNGVSVIFYAAGANGAPPTAVYRVSIVGGRVTGRETFLAGNRPPLGAHEARMAAARAATDALDHHPCTGEDFNVFVVPPQAPDAAIDVYQISPQSQRGHFPLGGHFKSTVARDGTVSASDAVGGACADVAVPDPAAGGAPSPIAVNRGGQALPSELDVFLALWTGHPLRVTAGDPPHQYSVTGEAIARAP